MRSGLQNIVPQTFNNLVDLLRRRVQAHPDRVLYRFLSDQEGLVEERTYAQLDERARAIAAQLQKYDIRGGRALMLYPSGLEFVEAFFGCLYAGVIAVPAYPPRKNQKLGRLQSIIDSCKPSIIVCSKEVEELARPLFRESRSEVFNQLHWLNTELVENALASHWEEILISGEDIAFLQYTSGSTGDPKGVMVSHENIMVNEEMIRVAFDFREAYTFVSWLPMFHDMGLIGTTLHPIYLGANAVLMTPASFLRQPLRWLKAISDYRAEVSVAPNFAYELCVSQISEDKKSELDLSCWTHALSGAEPVRAETLYSFHDYFAECGFSWDAYYPVYGMAETTLIITGGGSVERPRIETVSAEELAQNRVKLLAHSSSFKVRHSDAQDIVGVGRKVLDQEVVLVDPESRQRVSEGKVGEIWVRGKHVGKGYWNNESLSKEIFSARIVNDDGSESGQHYLRTGDLGCFLDEELFITGRLKEVIIIRGRNYYPYDIELVAQQSHPYLKADASAAFSVEVKGQEQIVIFIEVERRYRSKINGDEIASAVRKAVAREHGLQVYGVYLLKPGRIPKTSSGKIQRGACKRAFENDSMEFISKSLFAPDFNDRFRKVSLNREQLASLTEAERKGKIIEYLRASAAVLLQVDVHEIPVEQALTSLGLDSLQVTQLVSRVRDHLQVELAIDELFDLESLTQVAELTNRLIESDSDLKLLPLVKSNGALALSFSQQRLWFLDQLDPGNAAYNNPAAVKISGKLDIRILSQCIEEIVRRHEVLRTYVIEVDGAAQPVLQPAYGWVLPLEDLSSLSPAARDVEVKCLASEEAACTFNLEHAPLFRTRLLQLSELDSEDESYVLLLTAHHIVSDGWSLNILLEELTALYACYSIGQPSPLPELHIQYYDFAAWQKNWLTGEVLERQLAYWREKLADVPALELPLDFPRPPVMSQRGKQVSFEVSRTLTSKLKQLSQQQGVTLYMTLFAAFAVLLHRYSGQNDFAIGTPIANRTRAELERLIGFFVNTLALRIDLSNAPTFIEVLERVQEVTLGAYANQDLPFEKLVEELGIVRDMSHTPLFQVMFSFQNSPIHLDMDTSDLEFELMQVHGQSSKFDLSLDLRESAGGIKGFVEYSSDIFEEATIERLCKHLVNLFERICLEPGEAVKNYEFLSADELKYLLVDLNNHLDEKFDATHCIHHWFEKQSILTPAQLALQFEQYALSYQELNSYANQLARYFAAQGITQGELVGICLDRNQHLLPVLLAVLKLGAAYVPLDPKYPSVRLEQIIYAADAKFLICDQGLRKDLPTNNAQCIFIEQACKHLHDYSEANLDLDIEAGNLAYVIYTSGSTGLPKGVAIEHRSASALIFWANQQFQKAELEAVLASTSICFDLSIFEFFVPLSNGGAVYLVDNVLDLIKGFSHEISLINTVPSAISSLLANKAIPPSVRTINLAGEALSSQLVDSLYETGHVNKVYDLYGPSEDTTYSTCKLRERFSSASIGRPIVNTQAYILDQNLKPVPQGVPGELYLAGAGLARGYYQQEALTKERFINNPFRLQLHKGFGERLYKTGDLVRYQSSGDIEYLGRKDFQIKLRGFRIELGEVQAALSRLKYIRESVAIVRDDIVAADEALKSAGASQILVAYIVFHEGHEIESVSLNSFLRSKLKEMLPAYMVPSIFVPLKEIPLTPNGKTDRARLPIPDISAMSGEDYREPRNAFEQGMGEIWATVLNLKKIGIYDNFFDLGGHSLLATQVVARIRNTFQIDIPVRVIFDHPTIFELAGFVSEKISQEDILTTEIMASEQERNIPLSYAQQRLWFLHLLDKNSAAYNMPGSLRLSGALDIEALEKTLLEIVSRHSILRSRFYEANGQVLQEIQAKPQQWKLECIQLDSTSASPEKQLQDFSRLPFDLEDLDINVPEKRLLKTRLLRLSGKEHVLLFNMHHVVSDGWSLGVLLNELKVIYECFRRRQDITLASDKFQYRDYALWQKQWMSGARLEKQLKFWKQKLSHLSVFEFPADKPRPAVQSSNGDRVSFNLPVELCNKLHRQTREQNVTLFMLTLAGFKALLYRYTGQQDIAIGTPIANRTHPEWESLIGFFVNTLVLRTEISPDYSFVDLLKQVQETTLEAYANKDLPFDKLVEEMNWQRDVSHSPLFQVAFTLQSNAIAETLEIDRLKVKVDVGATRTSKFDLTMELRESEGLIRGELEYNTDLFNRSTIENLLLRYEVLLTALLEQPRRKISEAPLLSPTEQTLMLEQSLKLQGMTHTLLPVHTLFEQQVLVHGSKVALRFGDACLGYLELNEQANQLARLLLNKGAVAGQLIPLFVERSVDLIIGVLACLKVGAAYVPIDPMSPDERIEYVLNDIAVAQEGTVDYPYLSLSQSALLERMPQHYSNACIAIDQTHAWHSLEKHNLETPPDLNQAAYVIYTSGTTGKPKGVVVNHGNVARLFKNSESLFDFNERDVWTLFHSFSFDFSVWEMWGALLYGGELVIIPHDLSRSTEDFYEVLAKNKVSILNQTPSAFSQLIAIDDKKRKPLALRKIIFGGEALDFSALRLWIKHHGLGQDSPKLINMYGITETTVHVTCYELKASDFNSHKSIIGLPLPDLQAFVLDGHRKPVPKGVVGELYVGGAGVAQGYLNRPDLSKEKFIHLNILGEQQQYVYRTGDLVRVLDDGNLEYLGRSDDQVKIRGFRIELSEIEFNLNLSPLVRESIVLIKTDSQGEDAIVAYVAVNHLSETSSSDVRASLIGKLPEYMIPKAFVLLKQLPLTVNGKIDKHALKDPDWGSLSSSEYIAPRNDTEYALAEIWAEVLNLDSVGIFDNFFEIGGHSLLATRIVSRVREQLAMELPLATIFEMPTVADLAFYLIEKEAMNADESLLEALLDEIEGEEQALSSFHAGESVFRK